MREMQKKIKTLVKTFKAERGLVTLKLSLLAEDSSVKAPPVYRIAAETDDEISIARINANLNYAASILDTLYDGEVTPVTLDDIIGDMFIDTASATQYA